MSETSSQVGYISEGDRVVVHVAMTFKRRAGRKEIILPTSGAGPSENIRQKRAILLAIAQAYRWQGLLEEGRFRSISDLGRVEAVDVSYLCRMLRLTSLAPDIVAAVLQDEEPGGLSLSALMRAPMQWEEQRRLLGFGFPRRDI